MSELYVQFSLVTREMVALSNTESMANDSPMSSNLCEISKYVSLAFWKYIELEARLELKTGRNPR